MFLQKSEFNILKVNFEKFWKPQLVMLKIPQITIFQLADLPPSAVPCSHTSTSRVLYKMAFFVSLNLSQPLYFQLNCTLAKLVTLSPVPS